MAADAPGYEPQAQITWKQNWAQPMDAAGANPHIYVHIES